MCKMKNRIRKLTTMAFVLAGQLSYSSEEVVYSDHTLFTVQGNDPAVSVAQLNTAQLGVLKIFPGDQPGQFNWSCVYRTPHYLQLLQDHKKTLNILANKLLKIALDQSLSLEHKNKKITEKSNKIIKDLCEIGFPVKGIIMDVSKAFNPCVDPNDLWKTPDLYVKGPSYIIEDTNTHGERLEQGYKAIFMDSPDIATVQEVQFGESFDIDFTKIHDGIMENYPQYSFTVPTITKGNKKYISHAITYFNNTIFTDVSDEYRHKIQELMKTFQCFGAKNERIQVHALAHLVSNLTYFVVNIHANYTDANKTEPYGILNKTLLETPRLIVAGDFNLKRENESHFATAIQNYSGVHKICITPEPQNIGNPTYDAIFIS